MPRLDQSRARIFFMPIYGNATGSAAVGEPGEFIIRIWGVLFETYDLENDETKAGDILMRH